MTSIRKRTLEDAIDEINSYDLPQERKDLTIAFLKKICLSVCPPITAENIEMSQYNVPGMYWEKGSAETEVTIGYKKNELLVTNMVTNEFELFQVGAANEPYPQEWLNKYFSSYFLGNDNG